MSKIEQIFKDALFGQLIYDGIITDFENLDSIIGGLDFLPTDNDRINQETNENVDRVNQA